jgi:hypothetical protein
VKVNGYTPATGGRDGAPSPRAWRISTDDGVFWLVEDGGLARLIRLPLPSGGGDGGAYRDEGACTACETLALTAETEAAGRWVRGERAGQATDRANEVSNEPP